MSEVTVQELVLDRLKTLERKVDALTVQVTRLSVQERFISAICGILGAGAVEWLLRR